MADKTEYHETRGLALSNSSYEGEMQIIVPYYGNLPLKFQYVYHDGKFHFRAETFEFIITADGRCSEVFSLPILDKISRVLGIREYHYVYGYSQENPDHEGQGVIRFIDPDNPPETLCLWYTLYKNGDCVTSINGRPVILTDKAQKLIPGKTVKKILATINA